jgi:hypothetical protein
MKIEHTPGPWFVRYCDDESFMCMTVISSSDHGPSNNSVFENEDDTIAVVYHQCNPTVKSEEPDEADANARLIAAAPDLLNALKKVIDDLALRAKIKGEKSLDISDGILYCAQKAINKAEGSQNEY